jgi:hypothetical protein
MHDGADARSMPAISMFLNSNHHPSNSKIYSVACVIPFDFWLIVVYALDAPRQGAVSIQYVIRRPDMRVALDLL